MTRQKDTKNQGGQQPHASYDIVGVRQLSAEQASQVRALRDLCNRHDGLDLKLSVTDEFVTQAREPYAFLCTVDSTLAGFCSLVGGDDPELELCGMVHPDYRRRGIGHALLRVAMDSARRRLATIRVLVICEAASTAGRAFMADAGASYSFSENRMEVLPPLAARTHLSQLQVRQARADDAPELARVIGLAFDQSESAESDIAEEIARDMTMRGERYYLAHLDTATVGAFKIITDTPKAYIYAFGVLPAYRRRGYGREMLEKIIPQLFAEGATAVGLEVDADNLPAQALYRAIGFRDVTVYGYYELKVPAV